MMLLATYRDKKRPRDAAQVDPGFYGRKTPMSDETGTKVIIAILVGAVLVKIIVSLMG